MEASSKITEHEQWDEDAHRQILTHNSYWTNEVDKDPYGNPSIHDIKRVSSAAGFGKASTRELVSMSLSHGFNGNFWCDATWSSHIFHLKMGMIPVDRKVQYVNLEYGLKGTNALKKYDSIKNKLESNALLEEDEKRCMRALKTILAEERGIENDEDITNTDIVEASEFFAMLQMKCVSYVVHSFIPKLLEILEESPNQKKPDTSIFGSVQMVLSEAGRKRWIEAIENHTEFKSFGIFDNLAPFMKDEQIAQLKKLDSKFL